MFFSYPIQKDITIRHRINVRGVWYTGGDRIPKTGYFAYNIIAHNTIEDETYYLNKDGEWVLHAGQFPPFVIIHPVPASGTATIEGIKSKALNFRGQLRIVIYSPVDPNSIREADGIIDIMGTAEDVGWVNPRGWNSRLEAIDIESVEIDLRFDDEDEVERVAKKYTVYIDGAADNNFEFDEPLFIGDGDSDLSLGALSYGFGGSEFFTREWTRTGLGDDKPLAILNLEHLLRSSLASPEIIRGKLYGTFYPHQTLVLEGRVYYFDGGTFNASDNYVEGDFYEIRDDLATFLRRDTDRYGFSGIRSYGDIHTLLADFNDTIKEFLRSSAVTVTTQHLAIGQQHTVIPIEPVAENIANAGDPIAIVNRGTGKPHSLVVAANYTALDPQLIVEPFTPEDPLAATIPPGSYITFTQGQVRSFITLLDEAIALGVTEGELLSILTIQLQSITADTGLFKSGNYIPGERGWALVGGQGDAQTLVETDNLLGRGTLRTAFTGQRVVIEGDTNRLRFFTSDNTERVRIGESVQGSGMQAKAGMRISDGILNADTVFTAEGATGRFAAVVGGNAVTTLLGWYDGTITYGIRITAVGANQRAAQFIGRVDVTQGDLVVSSGNFTVSGLSRLQGAIRQEGIVLATATPYTVASNVTTVRVPTSAEAFTINLPAASTNVGRVIEIVDDDGLAGTSTITINRAGSDTINGATSTTITSNYGVVTLKAVSTSKWIIVNRVGT
jgi:hypothetical protein